MSRRRIAVVCVAAALAGAAAVAFAPRRRLDPRGLVPAPGRHDVRILRDRWGVPHVFGRTDPDVAYGLAWAHAEDDFKTIQDSLLATRGKLAAEYGRQFAPSDYLLQLLRVWDLVEARYQKDLAPDTRALLEAYAAGLNHYAALHADEAIAALYPVRGQDLVAGTVHKLPLFFGLDVVLKDLMSEERARPSPAADAASPRVLGSNAFAVAPGRSADGRTRLLVNSHQPWEGPAAWYEAHLHSDTGWDAVGGLFPGAPLVLHGHNRHLGWAHTVNFPDLVDVYRLELDPADPRRYRFDGAWRTLESRTVPVEVRLLGPLRWTFQREALWSVHGPVLRTPRGTYALRIAGSGEIRQLEQWYRMNRARDLQEWQAALRLGALPMFNTVYADAAGHVGYYYLAALPRRPAGPDWAGELPGDTSALVWQETVPPERLPRVLDPPSGFVQSCNNTPFRTTSGPGNPEPAAWADTPGIETHMTNRALRALELLGGDPSISAEEFEASKYDVTYAESSEVAHAWRRLAGADGGGDALLGEALGVLRGWDRRAAADSPAAALALLTLEPGHRNEPLADTTPLLQRLRGAAASLRRHFGTLSPRLPDVLRMRRGTVELGLDGGPDLLHAFYARPGQDGRWNVYAGDSYVMIVEWDAQGAVRSRSIHQYGSGTTRPASPHFADQAPLFARHGLKPVWLDEADIRANLEREYRPGGS
jgi:penicillin amidase/acyl-homoserine-lactone acylase